MIHSWGILLFAGVAWSAAATFDVDLLAIHLAEVMNTTVGNLLPSDPGLPGFTIKLPLGNQWSLDSGRAGPTGNWSKQGKATLIQTRSHLFMTVPLKVERLRHSYKFRILGSCTGMDNMTTWSSFNVNMTIKISYHEPFDCVGEFYDAELQNFSEDDCNEHQKCLIDYTSCARNSYAYVTEYVVPFRANFCQSFPIWLRNSIQKPAASALRGFNFCPL